MKATKSMGKGKADAVQASRLSDYVYSTFRGSERDCAFATTTREESSSLACQSHTKLNTNNVWLSVRPRQPIYIAIDTPTCMLQCCKCWSREAKKQKQSLPRTLPVNTS